MGHSELGPNDPWEDQDLRKFLGFFIYSAEFNLSIVITIFAWQSLIRSESAPDENPAKTVACTIPNLAHACIVAAASMQEGM